LTRFTRYYGKREWVATSAREVNMSKNSLSFSVIAVEAAIESS